LALKEPKTLVKRFLSKAKLDPENGDFKGTRHQRERGPFYT
jgi:hypothetical protein